MRILWINNDGGGFADYVTLNEDVTIHQFLKQQMPDREPSEYLIWVNRQPVPKDYVLHEGDRITCTPTKIEGAVTV